MTKSFTRRAFFAAALSSVATVSLANAPLQSLRPVPRPGSAPVVRQIDAAADILREAELAGVVGYVVADARTGDVLESNAPTTPLPPASVTKAVTSFYAIEALGGNFRFATRVLTDGPIVDGVAQGNLILAGGGDPNFVTDELVSLVQAMTATGLREVKGQFYVWDKALPYREEIDPPQLDHLGYNPSVSGLNFNFNRVHFEWKRANGSYTVSMDARSDTQRPPVYTSRMQIVNRSVPVYTYAQAGGIDEWTVARGALGNSGSRWLPVRNPALYAGDVFQTIARSLGVVLENPKKIEALPTTTEIVSHQSATLTNMMRSMLRFSTNITAEAAGMSATRALQSRALDVPQSAAQMSRWVKDRAGISPTFVDHSGLSDQSKISAQDMVKLLAHGNAPARLRPIMKTIVMTDADRDAIKNFPAQVVAKTGTLNFVSTLAGYVTTDAGRDLTFAIFTADLTARERGKQAADEQPAGSIAWNRRSKRLQQRLLQRWALVYDPQVSATQSN